MKFVLFCQSFAPGWNHGNAHFMRGVVRELCDLGHAVDVHEPRDDASPSDPRQPERSADGLVRGTPGLVSHRYSLQTLDLDRALDGADVVLVQEWNEPELIGRLGTHRRRRGGPVLLFHDTHLRAATTPGLPAPDLRDYDGALVVGAALADAYARARRVDSTWVWHEAADHRVFRPLSTQAEADVAWIGQWGGGERAEELREYLLGPLRALGLRATLRGVRWPEHALAELAAAGVRHRGWLPSECVPAMLARHRVAVHVPSRAFADELAGVPTIRVFEALACGVPLVSAPWEDPEGLFRDGDFLVARDGAAMAEHLRTLLAEPELASVLGRRGRRSILERHTCQHRAYELLAVARGLGGGEARMAGAG